MKQNRSRDAARVGLRHAGTLRRTSKGAGRDLHRISAARWHGNHRTCVAIKPGKPLLPCGVDGKPVVILPTDFRIRDVSPFHAMIGPVLRRMAADDAALRRR